MELRKKTYTVAQELEDTVKEIRRLSGLDIVVGNNAYRLERIYDSNGGRVGITYNYNSQKSLLKVATDMKDFLELMKKEGKTLA